MTEIPLSIEIPDHRDDTIFALASGLERAAIAIFRVSGPQSAALLKNLAGSLPKPRLASLRKVWASQQIGADLLDEALVLWFPGPHSYTGEDSFELHLHASPAIVEAVAQACVDFGARPAEAGEFTRRAFVYGKLDLVQAEGVADLIAAETKTQRHQAMMQTQGALSHIYHEWRHELKQILAFSEALIDFSDEELPEELADNLRDRTRKLIRAMHRHIDDGNYGRRIRQGLVIAIVGPPNVGKSTFLNWISERDAAITSPIAGTTRDALEIVTTIGGVKVTFVDTAGLRETADIVESEGVKRAMFHVKHCDFSIQLFTPEQKPSEIFEDALLVGNKADLGAVPQNLKGHHVEIISFKKQTGLEQLRNKLIETVRSLTATRTSRPYLTRSRHSAAVKDAVGHLQTALNEDCVEIYCEELRLAMNALGRLTGYVNTEELLDSVFSEFCIGK